MTDTDHLYLTREQRRTLSTRLKDISTWAADALDDAIIRRVAGHRTPGKTGERPLEYNERLSLLAEEATSTYRAWAQDMCTNSTARWPGEKRLAGWATWIDHHLVDLSKLQEAPQALDELTDVHKRIMAAIDVHQAPEFVGPCQSDDAAAIAKGATIADPVTCKGIYCPRGRKTFDCGTCGVTIDVPTVRASVEEDMRGRLFTKKDLRTALVMFAKIPVTMNRIDNWIKRGRLIDKGNGMFALDEALQLLADVNERQATRRSNK